MSVNSYIEEYYNPKDIYFNDKIEMKNNQKSIYFLTNIKYNLCIIISKEDTITIIDMKRSIRDYNIIDSFNINNLLNQNTFKNDVSKRKSYKINPVLDNYLPIQIDFILDDTSKSDIHRNNLLIILILLNDYRIVRCEYDLSNCFFLCPIEENRSLIIYETISFSTLLFSKSICNQIFDSLVCFKIINNYSRLAVIYVNNVFYIINTFSTNLTEKYIILYDNSKEEFNSKHDLNSSKIIYLYDIYVDLSNSSINNDFNDKILIKLFLFYKNKSFDVLTIEFSLSNKKSELISKINTHIGNSYIIDNMKYENSLLYIILYSQILIYHLSSSNIVYVSNIVYTDISQIKSIEVVSSSSFSTERETSMIITKFIIFSSTSLISNTLQFEFKLNQIENIKLNIKSLDKEEEVINENMIYKVYNSNKIRLVNEIEYTFNFGNIGIFFVGDLIQNQIKKNKLSIGVIYYNEQEIIEYISKYQMGILSLDSLSLDYIVSLLNSLCLKYTSRDYCEMKNKSNLLMNTSNKTEEFSKSKQIFDKIFLKFVNFLLVLNENQKSSLDDYTINQSLSFKNLLHIIIRICNLDIKWITEYVYYGVSISYDLFSEFQLKYKDYSYKYSLYRKYIKYDHEQDQNLIKNEVISKRKLKCELCNEDLIIKYNDLSNGYARCSVNQHKIFICINKIEIINNESVFCINCNVFFNISQSELDKDYCHVCYLCGLNLFSIK